MIGTDPSGQGGIASVVSVLVNEGFLHKYGIRYISSHSAGGGFKKLAVFAKAVSSVINECYVDCPRVVHVHAASRASFIRKSLLLAIARACGCKTIFHLHGGGFDRYATEECGKLMKWWVRRTLEKSTKVIALSDEWAQFISSYASRADVSVIPNSVQLLTVSDHGDEEEGRILFLGRSETHKGIFELLTAISLLKSTYPTIKLVIAGDGDLAAVHNRAQELGITECIEILGWIGQDQKTQELRRACIFTLPSYAEGLPMSMLEAMSAEKAIVVTSVGGISSVVSDQVNGLLIPPRDTSALVEALGKLLADKQLRVNIASNARRMVEQSYSTDIVMEKLSSFYDELCRPNQI